MLLNPKTHDLHFSAGQGFRTVEMERALVSIGEGLAGRVAHERRPVSRSDLARMGPHPRAHIFRAEGFRSYYGVPLIAKGTVRGVLEAFQRSTYYADPEWLDVFDTMASRATLAIEKAELFENLQHSTIELAHAYDATLEGWTRALDLRDRETEGHTKRVTEMTLKLAPVLEGSLDLVHLRRGALLHDIGKMGIPDAILLKEGPLTPHEWATMRLHPIYAHQMLYPIEYLRPAIDIPYCHHERWDGAGYPRGLAGEDIPLAARVFAVVDVWDALRSDRPYRRAWPEAQALTHIREGAGSQFDPRVVEAFLQAEVWG
jgi:putative nucleotidyltransferase with HDIG domain